MTYGSWDREGDGQNFLSFWTLFSPFTSPLTTQKIKFWKKEKKTAEGIIILHMCTINENHMMYGSWDEERSGQSFLSFWTFFFPFTHLWTQKITPGDVIILHMRDINDNYMMCGLSDMERNGQHLLSFWTAFCPLTP